MSDVTTLTTLTLTDRERRMLANALLLNVSIQETLAEDPRAIDRGIKLLARLVEGLPG